MRQDSMNVFPALLAGFLIVARQRIIWSDPFVRSILALPDPDGNNDYPEDALQWTEPGRTLGRILAEQIRPENNESAGNGICEDSVVIGERSFAVRIKRIELTGQTMTVIAIQAEVKKEIHQMNHDLKGSIRGLNTMIGWIDEECQKLNGGPELNEYMRVMKQTVHELNHRIDWMIHRLFAWQEGDF
ncbi:hypothetical protein JXA80_02180 [bacterium]|nr:hypothetical protein [candidate division CSSED10-310 bacterium]